MFGRLSYRLGVRPSFRPSVCHTLQPYQNSTSYDHEIFTMGCHNNSNFLRQNFLQLDEKIPLEWGSEKEVPPKSRYYTAVGSFANRYWDIYLDSLLTRPAGGLLRGISIDDYKRPWTSKIWDFSHCLRFFAPART